MPGTSFELGSILKQAGSLVDIPFLDLDLSEDERLEERHAGCPADGAVGVKVSPPLNWVKRPFNRPAGLSTQNPTRDDDGSIR